MAGFCEISRRSQLRFCELRGGIAKSLQPDPRNIPLFGRLALETRLENPLHGGPGIKPNGHIRFIQGYFRGNSELALTVFGMINGHALRALGGISGNRPAGLLADAFRRRQSVVDQQYVAS
jgi:hypothetical protein